MEDSIRIQAIKNTIGIMDIKPTEENVDRLFGIYRELNTVQQNLIKSEKKTEIGSETEKTPEEVSE